MNKLAIDLCCGKGGWTRGLQAAGFQVIGFDIERFDGYPGQLVLQDIRTMEAKQVKSASLIVASPPCQEFSRHDQPWTRQRNPPPPDLSIAEACYRLWKESGVPMVLENVRGSKRWLEPLFGPSRRARLILPLLRRSRFAAQDVRERRKKGNERQRTGQEVAYQISK